MVAAAQGNRLSSLCIVFIFVTSSWRSVGLAAAHGNRLSTLCIVHFCDS